MNKTRLESLSDGIIAIIITVMVFNLKPPLELSRSEMYKFSIQLLCYVESFFIVGIFWYKHNSLFSQFDKLNGATVWFNHLFLLFLSLIPMVTTWASQNPNQTWPRFAYGLVILFCLLSFLSLKAQVIKTKLRKIKLIIIGNILSTIFALFYPWIAYILFGFIGLSFLLISENSDHHLKQS